MKRWGIAAILFFVTSARGWSQCLPLNIFISDYSTKQPVQAQLFIRANGLKKSIGLCNEQGNLPVNLPCNTSELIAEKEGYQPLILHVAVGQTSLLETSYRVPLALIPLDKQVLDRPYSQSEQKEFVLKEKVVGEAPVETRLFKISDVLNNAGVNAEICFFYTKTRKKACFNTSVEMPTVEIQFQQPDIIAIEVKAEGYQPYNGNLILETFEGKRRIYEIKLNRPPTLFSALVKSSELLKRSTLKDQQTGRVIDIETTPNGQWAVAVEARHSYEWNIWGSKGQVVHHENLTFIAGLNHRAVLIKQTQRIAKPVPTETPPVQTIAAEPVAAVTISSSEPLLYFERSTYELSPVTRQRLEQWAAWWQQNPTKKIKIEGHSDNIGDARLNQLLSENRAKVVATYLFNHGVPDNCLYYEGFGSTKPAFPNDNEENRKKNRRVEIREITP